MAMLHFHNPARLACAGFMLACALALTACEPTLNPDYRVQVVQTPQGAVAVPPTCANWQTQNANPFDLQPMPQFGCANARNLAMNVEQPNDLLQGRTMGPASGVTGVGSILRYNANQTRGLIDPESAAENSAAVSTAPSTASPISGELFTIPSSASAGGLSATSSAAGAGGGATTSAAAP